ncbi:MAG: hypothetical protein GC187_11915 [Alphaproteobacteria bacterium]|nr:hypothetical protein [Alphaproteobacteria bacterium]
MNDEPREPLFTHPEPGPRFAIKTLAHAISGGGVPYPTAHARVAGYTKKRLVEVRVKGAATQPNLYAASDMAVAVLLSALQDLGVADLEVQEAASLACYAWRYPAPDGASGHPVHHVLDAAVHGESVVFQLDVFRNTGTGQRHFRAFFLNASRMQPIGEPMEPSADWAPMAGIIVVLDNHLQPVLKAVRDAQHGASGH